MLSQQAHFKLEPKYSDPYEEDPYIRYPMFTALGAFDVRPVWRLMGSYK